MKIIGKTQHPEEILRKTLSEGRMKFFVSTRPEEARRFMLSFAHKAALKYDAVEAAIAAL